MVDAISKIETAAGTAETLDLRAVIDCGERHYSYRLSTWPAGAYVLETEEGQRIASSSPVYQEPGESLEALWRRATERSSGGELRLSSISARSSQSPLSGRELREVTIAAWCDVTGRAVPTDQEMTQTRRQRREATLDREDAKEREQKTLGSGTRQDLWAEIMANPDHDEPRLVYADWLEENGLADQADFIRRHLQLPRDRSGDLEQSIEQQLCYEQHKSWSHIPEVSGLSFDRGFVSRLVISSRQFIKHATEIEERIPVLSFLSLGSAANYLSEIADVSALALAGSLQMRLVSPDVEGWKTLLRSPHLANLSELNLTATQMKQAFWAELYQSELIQRVESLWLNSCKISGASMQRLVDSLQNCRLQKLSVAFNHIGEHGLQAILDSPEFSGLRELDISRTGVDESAIGQLAAAKHLRSLRCLKLGWDDMTESTCRELFSSENLPELKELFLDNNRIQ